MRIIGGKHKGRKMKSFDGFYIRPTSDRAREALFNIFSAMINGCRFLDGFCGSGLVGIEALSRGASVVMTDVSAKSVALTKENLALINESATVIKIDCIDYLKTTDQKFDLIFLDPPYAIDAGERALEIIAERRVLNSGGYVVIEKDKPVQMQINGLIVEKIKKYGKAYFTVYKENYER
ncbi:MAG: 16S rRNA (guanine(966)-N(2))-methyltransferase RsmD [Clostridia bacterium]|nr:16S rRNA (guanine(966)-N(2))-methyltransferase RsmD [Clostridia bacterium]